MLDTLPNTLLAVAEIGSNRLLSFDQRVLKRCRALEGHCVAIHLTDLDLKLYCHPGSWGISLSQTEPAKPVEATISGRLFALFNLAQQEDKISTSIQERVRINGDAAVAQQMQKIFTELEIDWEEVLSDYTGDVLAYQIHQRARGLGNWLRQSAESLLQTSSEYLTEEAHLSPTQVEFERFQQRVTELKHDVDRAEARLRRLLKTAFDAS
ncbi:MAG: SCP2 sterol-binding domain-containing protein [Proteobacteria bacterium]|nr:SCP2 sterol-binding domain-containing protein [Pseudomonadota bacterium]